MNSVLNLALQSRQLERDRHWLTSLTSVPVTAEAALELAAATFGTQATLATSFGPEDIVLMHLAHAIAPQISLFSIDTGRLPPETHEVMEAMRQRLGTIVTCFVPRTEAVEGLVLHNGQFSFRASVSDRRACCAIRKVEPLQRALVGKRAWVTGMRREQNLTRQELAAVEWDDLNGRIKFNPLAAWSRGQVWDYIKAHDLPYNRLHDQGYASIGCAPCSRAIGPGDDERAGRWWWESAELRECGLHRRQS
jgi:phosphoadenosine phosphosulfate reductase